MLEEQRKKKEGGKSSRKHLHKTLVRILGHILIKKFHSKKITKSSNNAQNHRDLHRGASTCTTI